MVKHSVAYRFFHSAFGLPKQTGQSRFQPVGHIIAFPFSLITHSLALLPPCRQFAFSPKPWRMVRPRMIGWLAWLVLTLPSLALSSPLPGQSDDGPEATIRRLVEANAQQDLESMKRYMATDEDVIGYTIGGRKFVGWERFAEVMRHEFASVDRLEIPITDLRVWQKGDVAWFAMELDYIRETTTPAGERQRTVIPLRETGVLERRDGVWMVVNWHESRQPTSTSASLLPSPSPEPVSPPPDQSTVTLDLSGQWDIHEEDKSYRATLDAHGNGTYTWQNGAITTVTIRDRLWSGKWAQPGNDREGEFEVLLSEDLNSAEGVWWYTRVGQHENIPPREWGGSYKFERNGAPSPTASTSP